MDDSGLHETFVAPAAQRAAPISRDPRCSACNPPIHGNQHVLSPANYTKPFVARAAQQAAPMPRGPRCSVSNPPIHENRHVVCGPNHTDPL